MRARQHLTDFTPDELVAELAAAGFSAKDTRRLYAHQVQRGRRDFGVPHLSLKKQASLAARFRLPRLEVVDRRRSLVDGFTKYLFRLADGVEIEAVRIPIFEHKYTVCISSQVGCALGCVFCATGRLGFSRNLSAWEIVEQVRVVREEADRPVRGVVFMGMGEPLLNYDEVIRAARILSDPSGLAIDGRSITISTAGVVPAIRRYTREGHRYRLAVSLTAATSPKRRGLMPVEGTWPIEELIDAVREHARATRDRVTLEYVVISGVNCGPEDAAELMRLLDGIPVRLNLIDVNDATGTYLPPSPAELARFLDALRALGQPVVRRYSGGKDVWAGCGMLAGEAPPAGEQL
jgi:23S rRNA (adenine2503-C2)-methyltransferase